jgi:PBSX family phage terminase large subunit
MSANPLDELAVTVGKFGPKSIISMAQCDHRLNIWHGAIRSSKTWTSLVAWLVFLATAPRGHLLMIGRTERTLKRNILDTIEQWIPGSVRYQLGMGECRILGRQVYLAGASDARSEGKIRGLTLIGAYGDELVLWPVEVFQRVIDRMSLEGARFFGTTNPDSPHHWLRKDFLQRAEEHDLAAFHFQLRDNPTLPKAYIRSLDAEYRGLWHQRLVEGKWVLAQGAVYDMFDERQVVVDVLPNMTQFFVAIDYGTSNALVALLFGIGVDNRLYVIAEWVWDSRERGQQMTDAQYSKELRGWLREEEIFPRWTFVDPSAASFILQLNVDNFPNVALADNTVLDGVRHVSTLLGLGLLRIHRSCEYLRSTLPEYRWDAGQQKLGKDVPSKDGNDHAPDALRYGVNGTMHIWQRWLRQRDTVIRSRAA